mmetsp:Transcript_14893/g.28904  ORF Transcript_14893/g.28904 Transcript_14893/m.28904 type:complete len:417 (+) Transcript_14893:1111-2361(+)
MPLHKPPGLRLVSSVLVFRHGDRSPAINFFARHQTDLPTLSQEDDGIVKGGIEPDELPECKAERTAWADRMPSLEDLDKLNEQFPVLHVDGLHDAPNVVGHAPTPSSIDNRSDPFGKLTTRGMSQLFENGVKLRKRFDKELKEEDVLMFSSDYTRTHQSAQCFLRGLFDIKVSDLGEKAHPRVPVLIPPKELNVANTWEASPRLRALVLEYVSTPEFHDLESRHKVARKNLIAKLPYYAASPERFYWIYASDYFVTREAHGLLIDSELTREDRDSTLNCTNERFMRWYHDEEVSEHAAGSLLRKIREYMHKSVSGDTEKSLICFSGHDITILPVLCALGFRQGCIENSNFDKDWPPFASTLLFELLSDDDAANSGNPSNYVRVVYNDEEIVQPEPLQEFWETRPIFDLDLQREGKL